MQLSSPPSGRILTAPMLRGARCSWLALCLAIASCCLASKLAHGWTVSLEY